VTADGQAERVADINPGGGDSFPLGFTEFGGALYFHADDGSNGIELWRVTSDGQVEQVRDINPGGTGSAPH